MLRGSGCSSASDSKVGKPYLAGHQGSSVEKTRQTLARCDSALAPQHVTFELGGVKTPPQRVERIQTCAPPPRSNPPTL